MPEYCLIGFRKSKFKSLKAYTLLSIAQKRLMVVIQNNASLLFNQPKVTLAELLGANELSTLAGTAGATVQWSRSVNALWYVIISTSRLYFLPQR